MISHPSRHCTVELQALPSRIGQVRRILSAQLRYWHLDALIDRAALGLTELLTNVHRHAEPDKLCTVRIEWLLDRLMVSVRDHDPRVPVVADVEDAADIAPLATRGRGLAMVAAVSDSWGVRPDGEKGKVVWFTLPAPVPARPAPARPARRAPQEPRAPRFAKVEATVDAGPPAPATAPAPAPAPAHAAAPSAVPG
ncbi:ATP-binding protein [Streptomyces echinoruber]|uniref:ATP-binding protein n=1 Tax=Streptomyces echinoruber TaxID=68898 RepID=UPI0036086D56